MSFTIKEIATLALKLAVAIPVLAVVFAFGILQNLLDEIGV